MFPFSRHEVLLTRAGKSKHVLNPQTIGNHIRNRRLELKLTQKALAAMLGICLSTVVRWESGKEQPLPKQLPQIIEFLGHEPGCLSRPRASQAKVLQNA